MQSDFFIVVDSCVICTALLCQQELARALQSPMMLYNKDFTLLQSQRESDPICKDPICKEFLMMLNI